MLPKLREWHAAGYKLVIFGNRGGVKGAFEGKNAQKTWALADWLAQEVGVPLHAVYATRSGSDYYKPSVGMWTAMEEKLNDGVRVDPASSFYVGDMAGRPGDIGASDLGFALNVGKSRNVTMRFETPEEAFGAPAGPNGESGGGGGGGSSATAAHAPPQSSLATRAALLGGYLPGPRLLILCGPQGAGKSHFCSGLLSGGSGGGGGGGGGGAAASGSGTAVAASSAPMAEPMEEEGEDAVHVLSSSSDESDEESERKPAARAATVVASSGSASAAAAVSLAPWVVICQDTISGAGKPGSRDKCEREVRAALKRGENVVVDRTHLTVEQRGHFMEIGKEVGVRIDAVVLLPPLEEMQRRVRERVDHPGGVSGPRYASMVAKSYQSLVPPTHSEGFDLITTLQTPAQVASTTRLYARCVMPSTLAAASLPPLPASFQLNHPGGGAAPPAGPPSSSSAPSSNGGGTVTHRPLPSVALGTMNLRQDPLKRILHSGGFVAVDTSTGYGNETGVGAGLAEDAYLICKVPHKMFKAADVRTAINTSLHKLNRRRCQMLLLHWPANAIENDCLLETWGAMEAAVAAGQAEALGVCNFTVRALEHLLSLNPSIPPAVNQVERHPLLPQWELLDYCACHHIQLQAHTPLGSGNPKVLGNAVIRRVGEESGLTPAQVCLQWNLRHGVAVVPKCSSDEHARQALQATAAGSGNRAQGPVLSPAHMKWLDEVTPPGAEGFRVCKGGTFMIPGGAKRELYGW